MLWESLRWVELETSPPYLLMSNGHWSSSEDRSPANSVLADVTEAAAALSQTLEDLTE